MRSESVALVTLDPIAVAEGLRAHALQGGCLVETGVPFDAEPDELALAIRQAVGASLDGHRDPRGLLVLPAECLDRALAWGRYDTIASELGIEGTWCPPVALDHVPRRFAEAAPGTLEALVGQAMRGESIDPAALEHLLATLGDSTPDDSDSDERNDDTTASFDGRDLAAASMLVDEDAPFEDPGTDPEFTPSDTSLDLPALSSPLLGQLDSLARALETDAAWLGARLSLTRNA